MISSQTDAVGTCADLPDYEVYAVRYATVERRRSENFMAHDPHDGPMPMDYFVWVVRHADRVWLVDTGFNEKAAAQRAREFLRCPITALSSLGISPEHVSDVILTHLHYDHAGNVDRLPNARLHIQEAEMHYAVGRHMCFGLLRHPYAADDVVEVVRGVHANRVHFYDGDAQLAPGLHLVRVGGHTQGLQAVRVHTARGWLVLASDASHFYDNVSNESPFPIVFHVGEMLEGYRKLLTLADTFEHHFIPGHDPAVMSRFPAVDASGNEIVALHAAPVVMERDNPR